MALMLLFSLGCSQTMYRKTLPFGTVPKFCQMPTGEGTVAAAGEKLRSQFARFGSVTRVAGRLAFAAPAEAHTPALDSSVSGAIAVVTRDKCSFETKKRMCASSGAIGRILVNSEDELFVADPHTEADPAASLMPNIPFVVVSSSDGAKLGCEGDGVLAPLVVQQLARNPARGKELLEQAAFGTPRPPREAAAEDGTKRGWCSRGSGGSSRAGAPQMLNDDRAPEDISSGAPSKKGGASEASAAASEAAARWMLRVDIGREEGSTMPAAWAKSGARLPFSVEIEIQSAPASTDEPKVGTGACAVEPCDEHVRLEPPRSL